MVVLRTSNELSEMKLACQISAQALKAGGEMVKPGVTTADINRVIHEFILSKGAKPTFLGYGGFPAAACISVNNEVIHGIPSAKRVIKEGDIVSIDVGAFINGYTGDNAATFPAGKISRDAEKLIEATKQSLMNAIKAAQPGNRLGDVGFAVQSYVEQFGFAVVRDFVGHGVGKKLHEPPEVPNYGTPGRGIRLMPGMTIAIEPMINQQGEGVVVQKDGTVLTESGSLSAHFEHTIAITSNGPIIMTEC